MKKGIELEYFTVDSSGKLATAENLAEKFEFADPEFAKCIIEIKSDPYETVEELREDIKRKILNVVDEAEKQELYLVPLGTPLNHENIELIESERLELMRQFNTQDIKIEKKLARIGFHIHFEKKNVKDQLNILTALDPASAVLNSSPYHKGENKASSCRNWVYRYDWTPKFPSSIKLWEYTQSVEKWKQRMHSAFDQFKQGALEAGVKEEKFDENYHPDRSIWTPIRLRDQFPTVEYRSPDACLPSQALKLVKDLDNILEKSQGCEVEIKETTEIKEEKIVLPRFEKVSEMSREAVKEGIDSPRLRNYLNKFGIDADEYSPISQEIKGESLALEEASELRLKMSEKLRRDVESL